MRKSLIFLIFSVILLLANNNFVFAELAACGCYCGKVIRPPCSDDACKQACGWQEPAQTQSYSQPAYDYQAEQQREEEAERERQAERKAQAEREAEEHRLKQEEFEKNKQDALNSMKGISENELGLKGVSTDNELGLKGAGDTGSSGLGLKTLFEKPIGEAPAVDVEKERIRLVREDTKAYKSQLQKLMAETDQMKVPPPAVYGHIHEGVILGLFSPNESDLFGVQSPFSGKKYRDGEVFATTNVEDGSEVVRGILDNHHMGEYTLNTPYGKELVEKLNGKRFDRLVAHSNGATIAEALIRKGVISVDELNIVGGDRSLINKWGLQELIDSGKVKRVVVWVNPGDVIPPGSSCVLPTPLKATGSIPLEASAAHFARRLTSWHMPQAEVEYRILEGAQYKGQEAHLDKTLFDAHSLKDAYLYNIKKYFDAKKEAKNEKDNK